MNEQTGRVFGFRFLDAAQYKFSAYWSNGLIYGQ
jgi:hypothetical protein